MPGINEAQHASRPGIDDDDMTRIREFLSTPAWQRTPEMLCPGDTADVDR